MKQGISIILFIAMLFSFAACMSPEYAHLKKGNEYSDKQKWNEAIAEYTKAIEAEPKLIQAYSNRAIAYTEKGEYEKAIADCTKAIELDPKSTIPYYNRSFAYFYNKEYEKAIADCDKILGLGLNSPLVYRHRGMAYLRLHDYESAISDFMRAKRVSTSSQFNTEIDQMIEEAQALIDKRK